MKVTTSETLYHEDHGAILKHKCGKEIVAIVPSFFFSHYSSSSSSLTFSLDGRRVSPLVLGSHGVGGARAPRRLDLSLCYCILELCPGTISFIAGDP